MQIDKRAEFLGRTNRRYQSVDCGGGLVMIVRSLNERERSEYEVVTMATEKDKKSTERLRTAKRRLIVASAVTEEGGDLLFRVDDVDALQEVDALQVNLLFDACVKLNGFADTDIEDLIKNSAPTAGND